MKQDDQNLKDRLLVVQGMFAGTVETMAIDPNLDAQLVDMFWASVC